MLCSEKFNRIFLHRQIAYVLISKMTKFGPASLKDDQVITRCDEIVILSRLSDVWVTFESRLSDEIVTPVLLHKIIFIRSVAWLVSTTDKWS